RSFMSRPTGRSLGRWETLRGLALCAATPGRVGRRRHPRGLLTCGAPHDRTGEWSVGLAEGSARDVRVSPRIESTRDVTPFAPLAHSLLPVFPAGRTPGPCAPL